MDEAKLISQKVYLDLKDKIMFGQYLPGVHLVEAELIEAYGVSRTTIRAALRQLIEDELVEMLPHKGIFVRKLTLKEVSDYTRSSRPWRAWWPAGWPWSILPNR